MLITFVCAVVPADVAPKISESDKVEHFIAFSTLTLFAVVAFQRINIFIVGAWLSAFGALIEVVQAIPSLHRDCDFWDWVTDTIAIAVVIIPLGLARLRMP